MEEVAGSVTKTYGKILKELIKNCDDDDDDDIFETLDHSL